MDTERYYELYGERWNNAPCDPWEEEYITSCTDPDEVRAISYCFVGSVIDGYYYYCINNRCIDQLEKLEGRKQ